MLTGTELGEALDEAIRLKGVSKAAAARHFGIKGPSIYDWINHGRIGKQHLTKLVEYFSDVVGPAHWGMSSAEASQPTRPSPDTLHMAFQAVVAALTLPDVKPEAVLLHTEGAEFVAGVYALLASGMTLIDLQDAPEMDELVRVFVAKQRGRSGHGKRTRRGRSTVA